MQGANSVLEKTFIADGALTKFRVGAKGTNEDDIALGAGSGAVTMGVIQHDAIDNAPVRVMLMGISQIEFGGNVTQGDYLVSDSNGKAVAATRHNHTENTAGTYTQNATTGAASATRGIGIAMCNGVDGDIGTAFVFPAHV